MPNHKKSLAELELNGAIKKNPQRFTNRKEPVPAAPIGRAPSHLSKEDKKLWKEVVSNCLPNTLGNSDTYVVELAVKLIHRLRTGQLTTASEISNLLNTLGRLGLTPQDRLRLNIDNTTKPERKDEIDWSKFVHNDGEELCQ